MKKLMLEMSSSILINSDRVLSILFFKNLTVIGMNRLIIDQLAIYHLSFLSKLTERLVKSRLTNFLASNNLLNTSQSAYIKFHSTENYSSCCT
jgi:hypothetical protein